jgi:ribosome-binding factor A
MSRKTDFTKQKFEEIILGELNLYLRKDLASPELQFISIVKVELNNDFSAANVYWDTFDSSIRGDSKKYMEQLCPKLRKLLSQNIKVRHTPSLKMHYHGQYDAEHKITELLKNQD